MHTIQDTRIQLMQPYLLAQNAEHQWQYSLVDSCSSQEPSRLPDLNPPPGAPGDHHQLRPPLSSIAILIAARTVRRQPPRRPFLGLFRTFCSPLHGALVCPCALPPPAWAIDLRGGYRCQCIVFVHAVKVYLVHGACVVLWMVLPRLLVRLVVAFLPLRVVVGPPARKQHGRS